LIKSQWDIFAADEDSHCEQEMIPEPHRIERVGPAGAAKVDLPLPPRFIRP
jgi:hypothetical protein